MDIKKCLWRLTTPKIPTTVIPTVMLIGVEKFFTGRSSFLVNTFVSSAANKDSGVGLVQFNVATKPGFEEKVENSICEITYPCAHGSIKSHFLLLAFLHDHFGS